MCIPFIYSIKPLFTLFCNFLFLFFGLAGNRSFKGSLLGISIGTVTQAGTVTGAHKIWSRLQALAEMALHKANSNCLNYFLMSLHQLYITMFASTKTMNFFLCTKAMNSFLEF